MQIQAKDSINKNKREKKKQTQETTSEPSLKAVSRWILQSDDMNIPRAFSFQPCFLRSLVHPQDILKKMIDLRCGVEGVPGNIAGPVGVSVVHTYRVDLLFVTFDSSWCSDVISEDPSLCGFRATSEGVNSPASVKG